jgi:hypothetical protein
MNSSDEAEQDEWKHARDLAAQWRAGQKHEVLASTEHSTRLLTKLLVLLNEDESRELKRIWIGD